MSNHQWSGRTILDPNDAHQLEQDAATYEFRHRMSRQDAEHRAYHEYQQKKHREAAAYHLKGIRASQAVGDGEEGRKHGAMYQLHMQALGLNPMDAVPGDIKSMAETAPEKFYRFKAHKGDLYALQKAHLLTGYASLKKGNLFGPDEVIAHLQEHDQSGDPDYLNEMADAVRQFPKWKLGNRRIADLDSGETRNPDIIEEYAAMPRSTRPAIVVADDNTIMDGGHRTQAAAARGEKTIRAFSPILKRAKLKKNWPDLQTEHGQQAFANTVSKPVLVESVPHGTPIRHSVQPIGNGGLHDAATANEIADTIDEDIPGAVEPSRNPVFQAGNPSDRMHERDYWQMVQASPILKRKGLKKAWPKNEDENMDHALGFASGTPHAEVARDAFLEHASNARNPVKEYKRNPVIKVPPEGMYRTRHGAIRTMDPHYENTARALYANADASQVPTLAINREPDDWLDKPDTDGTLEANMGGPFWDMNVPHERAYGHNPNFDPNAQTPSKEQMLAAWQNSPILKRKK